MSEDLWRGPPQQPCPGKAAQHSRDSEQQHPAGHERKFPAEPQMLPSDPGQMAPVLVALAAIGTGRDPAAPEM